MKQWLVRAAEFEYVFAQPDDVPKEEVKKRAAAILYPNVLPVTEPLKWVTVAPLKPVGEGLVGITDPEPTEDPA